MKYRITPKGAACHAACVAGFVEHENKDDQKSFELFWKTFEENLYRSNISFHDGFICSDCESKERYHELSKATQMRASIYGSLLGISLGINLILLSIILALV